MIAQHEAVARSLRDGVEQDIGRNAGALAHNHHFRERRDVLEYQRVVDQLDHLPAAGIPAAGHVTAHVAQERFDPREQRFARADHDAERAGRGGLAGASNGRVRELHSGRGEPRAERPGFGNARRAEVDHDQSAPADDRDTLFAEAALLDLLPPGKG